MGRRRKSNKGNRANNQMNKVNAVDNDKPSVSPEDELQLDAQGGQEEETIVEENASLASQHFGEEEELPEQEPAAPEALVEEQQQEEEEDLSPEPPAEDPAPAEEEEDDSDVDTSPEESATDLEPTPKAEHIPGQIIAVKAALEDYAQRMAAGKPQSVATLITNQRILFGALVGAFGAPDELRAEAVRLLYSAFRENTSGAFSERNVFRGIREMAEVDSVRASTLRGALSLILPTLDGTKREEVLQHMDVEPALRDIKNETVKLGIIKHLGLA